MKVFITGGSGFIGTNFIDKFVAENYEVLNCDILLPKKKSHMKLWKKVDIRRRDELSELLLSFNPDYIIHLAARTDLDGKKKEDYDSNVQGTRNIMEAAKKLPNLKKIIFTSSMLVCSSGYKPKDFFDMVMAKCYFHIGYCGCTKTYGYIGNAVYEIEKIMLADTENKIFYIGDYIPTNIEEWANEIAGELGHKIPRIPYWMMAGSAKAGDILKKINIYFPMTTFRLKNMTTTNVVDMQETQKVAEHLPFQRIDGIKETLKWMKGMDYEYFSV